MLADFTLDDYRRIASRATDRELRVMLIDARRDLDKHGRRSWMGKQARLAIQAAEDEANRRGVPAPVEGA